MNAVCGIDVHRKFSEVCVKTGSGKLIDRHRIEHDEGKAMTEYFSRFEELPVAIEATYGWMWVADLVESLGHEVHLANPAGVAAYAKRESRTDRLDADFLADLLRTPLFPRAYFPSFEIRQLRAVLRHRQSLVAIRTAVKCRIHALLAHAGISCSVSDIFGVTGREFLCSIELDPMRRHTLDQSLQLIDHLSDAVMQSEAFVRPHLESSSEVKLLKSIPGIGNVLAPLIHAEIGPVGRFANQKRLSAYAGLVPSVHVSGGKSHHGSLRKQSNRWLRWAMIEAAQAAVKSSKGASLRQFYQKLKEKKGGGKAMAALAHKLLIIVYQVLKTGTPYRLDRSCHRQDKPGHPMVVSTLSR